MTEYPAAMMEHGYDSQLLDRWAHPKPDQSGPGRGSGADSDGNAAMAASAGSDHADDWARPFHPIHYPSSPGSVVDRKASAVIERVSRVLQGALRSSQRGRLEIEDRDSCCLSSFGQPSILRRERQSLPDREFQIGGIVDGKPICETQIEQPLPSRATDGLIVDLDRQAIEHFKESQDERLLRSAATNRDQESVLNFERSDHGDDRACSRDRFHD